MSTIEKWVGFQQAQQESAAKLRMMMVEKLKGANAWEKDLLKKQTKKTMYSSGQDPEKEKLQRAGTDFDPHDIDTKGELYPFMWYSPLCQCARSSLVVIAFAVAVDSRQASSAFFEDQHTNEVPAIKNHIVFVKV